MHTPIPLALASLLIALPTAGAQAPFEGVITMMVTVPGAAPMENIMSVKGARGRSEMSMQGMQAYAITDFDKGTVTAVLPTQRMYMNLGEAMTKTLPDPEAAAEVTFKETGKKGTFAGVACNYYLIQYKTGMDADACIAKGIGTFFGMGAAGGRGNSAPGVQKAMRQLAKQFKGGAFVLRMDMREAGQLRLSTEVTKLEKKAVDDAVFVVPEGFQDMTAMMKGMPGARPPGGR
jgi:hypothetical protein